MGGLGRGGGSPAWEWVDAFISRNEKELRQCLGRSSMLSLQVFVAKEKQSPGAPASLWAW